LVFTQLEQIAVGEHLARGLGQLVERAQQLGALRAVKDCVLGGGGRLPRARDGAQRETLAAPGAPPPVARLVRDDAQQPRAQRLVRPEAAERAPGLDERVLRRVFGVRRIAGDDVGHSKCNLLMWADEFLVGVRVAALRAQHKLPLSSWTALHTRTTPRAGPEFQRSARQCGRALRRCPQSSARYSN